MRYTYYPGCTLYTTARSLNDCALKVAERIGFELAEMPAWTCCGAIYNTNSDDLAASVGPVRNLARASQLGDKLVTLCAACYNVLKRTNTALNDPEKQDVAKRLLDYVEEPFERPIEVIHYLEVLRDDIGWDQIRGKVTRPLSGLKVASYYGCLMVRPPKVLQFDNPTNPMCLDDLMAAIGAEPVQFDFKTKCCGGYLVVSQHDVAVKCSRRIIDNAADYNADVLVTTCPLCHYNLDALQRDMKAEDPDFQPIPVLYFTQLLGLATGLRKRELALDYNKIDPRPVLKKVGNVS
ncbi:hypothetical protein CH330_08835 [candidate division WOR-3 bacterium JGI_Cruoil_03_51_56]|uniref:AdoMet activation domain-containing protein n=1 Tax=candidate division WOR-3 bacterium JGI_Cruoil_03_51_56 TaxID=1973747 RepID=A0A235BQ49_UNCW3|nr:MAG: hypothetical protein CH330_08835 [candidate division WOR-3 bacterium JGI_Cruoil_03_51_56]